MMNGIQMGYEKYMQLHATYVLEVTLAADSMLAAELLPKLCSSGLFEKTFV